MQCILNVGGGSIVQQHNDNSSMSKGCTNVSCVWGRLTVHIMCRCIVLVYIT